MQRPQPPSGKVNIKATKEKKYRVRSRPEILIKIISTRYLFNLFDHQEISSRYDFDQSFPVGLPDLYSWWQINDVKSVGLWIQITDHYYFDEMRSPLNLVQNQLFELTKLNIYKTNCLNISNRTSAAAVQKKGMWNKMSMELIFVKTLLNKYFLKCLKS
jgi:hypothetical protein